MYTGKVKDWFKHFDFLLLDLLCILLAFCGAYALREGDWNHFGDERTRVLLILMLMGMAFSAFLIDAYKDILKRGYYKELTSVVRHAITMLMVTSVTLFLAKLGGSVSRLQVGLTTALFALLSYEGRLLRKRSLRNRRGDAAASLLLITTAEMAEPAVNNLLEMEKSGQYRIAGVAILDQDCVGHLICGVPVVAGEESVVDYICRNWVDEVFFDLGHGYVKPSDELQQSLLTMGIATHVKLYNRTNNYEWDRRVEILGPYTVITRAIHVASPRQQVLKRLMDILGALVGILITGILTVIIGPIIFLSSPGPIFFKQKRVGMNGRMFYMYKFRSMVMNADALKEKYMAQNRVGDGMMFKLDWDPRIIGNRELPDGTRKTGIGEFIRKTSIDEFPQFINVLKGDMSLVGTRPPTLDEWNKYELHHRARMAIKPGITGMWQISGRSNITDFEEVVRLDREYISKWSIGLDIKILLKTVLAVLKKEGSM